MTAPYYQRAGITLYLGDCREVYAVPPRTGLTATDPPYGIAHPTDYAARGRSDMAKCRDYIPVRGDDQPFDPTWLLTLGEARIIWGANHFSDKLPPSSGWLVWDKERPDDLDQATCELAWTDCVKGVRRLRHLWNGMMRASREALEHPTQKPEVLMRWCLGMRWTRNFRIVRDPYMGAGSTVVAAAQLGWDAEGVEIEERYCEVAAKRVDAALDQGAIFARSLAAPAVQPTLEGVA